jgi:hypothetical protein
MWQRVRAGRSWPLVRGLDNGVAERRGRCHLGLCHLKLCHLKLCHLGI